MKPLKDKHITYLIIGAVVGGVLVYLMTKVFPTIAKASQTKKLIALDKNDNNINKLLREIRDDAREQIPVGEVYDRQVTVTQAVTLIDESVNNGRPLNWSSVDIVNKGPDPVYACVNEWLDPQASISMNQSMNFDFKKRGAIQKLFLKCDAGNTAIVAIHIVE